MRSLKSLCIESLLSLGAKEIFASCSSPPTESANISGLLPLTIQHLELHCCMDLMEDHIPEPDKLSIYGKDVDFKIRTLHDFTTNRVKSQKVLQSVIVCLGTREPEFYLKFERTFSIARLRIHLDVAGQRTNYDGYDLKEGTSHVNESALSLV